MCDIIKYFVLIKLDSSVPCLEIVNEDNSPKLRSFWKPQVVSKTYRKMFHLDKQYGKNSIGKIMSLIGWQT